MTPENLNALQNHLAVTGGMDHRATLVISGDRNWAKEAAESVVAYFGWADCWWLENGEPDSNNKTVIAMNKSHSLLGQECQALVFDAHTGFDADAFGVSAGLIRKGGALILLVPPLQTWIQGDDPQAARLAVYPEKKKTVGKFYLRRLAHMLGNDESVAFYHQANEQLIIPEPPAIPLSSEEEDIEPEDDDDPACLTKDQKEAVQAVTKVARGHRRRPLVLTADRGRGKSAALGIAAGRLLNGNIKSIIVTAPNKEAANVIFAQAEANTKKLDSRLKFMAPDELVDKQPDADLLLVDEAAAIPVPLLTKLLKRYSRIAFSTTVHGYEGAGRGFAVRFKKVLDEVTPQWRAMNMLEPVRWAPGDPLEKLTFRLLMLDAGPADEQCFTSISIDDCEIQKLNSKQLLQDEALLREVFGLLVLAHYRTSPQDLRILLDGPNISAFAMRYQGHIAATALVAEEGGIEPELADAVWRGERRVRGHLLPQTLANHAGFPAAASLKGERIVRIAVHPSLQGQGLGTRFVKLLATRAASSGMDWFGTSFGASPDVLGFWQGCTLLPVRVGITREASSGSHSVVMMRALTSGAKQVFEPMRRRFSEVLLDDLNGSLSRMEVDVVWRLFHGLETLIDEPSEVDWRDARSFADSRRGLDLCRLGVRRIITTFLAVETNKATTNGLSLPQQALVMKVFQHARWSELAQFLDLPGRRQVEQALRETMSQWLKQR